jgi:hypothetical protein
MRSVQHFVDSESSFEGVEVGRNPASQEIDSESDTEEAQGHSGKETHAHVRDRPQRAAEMGCANAFLLDTPHDAPGGIASAKDSDDESEKDSDDESEKDSDDESEKDSDDESEKDSDDESEKDSDDEVGEAWEGSTVADIQAQMEAELEHTTLRESFEEGSENMIKNFARSRELQSGAMGPATNLLRHLGVVFPESSS